MRSAASKTLIARTMQTFTIKSVTRNKEDRKPHFFVLNKGLNSGKPLLQPCQNCFKIEAENEELREMLYWISFALWKSKAFHPFLIGSVIPFLRIGDFKLVICEKLEVVNANPGEFANTVEKLRFFDIKEKQLKDSLRLVQELKQAYVHSYFNRKS
jgi:hypothetical protein